MTRTTAINGDGVLVITVTTYGFCVVPTCRLCVVVSITLLLGTGTTLIGVLVRAIAIGVTAVVVVSTVRVCVTGVVVVGAVGVGVAVVGVGNVRITDIYISIVAMS